MNMKRIIIAILLALPLGAMAQSTLTPQEQLEQAQKQLKEAQAALEVAKANAAKAAEAKANAEEEAKMKAAQEAKAKADAEAQAKAAELQRQIEEAKAEAARLNAEAERLNNEAQQTTATLTTTDDGIMSTPEKPATMVNSKTVTSVTTVPSMTQTATLTQPGTTKTNSETYYAAEDAVPIVNGQVVWTVEISAPGETAAQVYQKLLSAQTQLAEGDNQLEGSRVAKADNQAYTILTTIREWLVFSNTFLSLDRAEMNFVLVTECHDGGATIKMSHIKYAYTLQNKTERYAAEEWITDEFAVNKKHTKLYRITGKFRRGTIDRKDAIFKYFADAIKLL